MEEKVNRQLYSDLDDLDYRIVKFLEDNARMPFTQIATELGVTERTIRMRVQQMQSDGILSLVGVVNPIKAGIRMQALIQIAVDQNKLDQVVEELMDTYEARLVVLTSGEYQLIIQVFTRDYEELSEFLMKKLNRVDGITRTNVIVELKVLKSRLKFIR
ncbi:MULTISPECIES: Lrp/AsnC family transcriptional regulator [Paenibacillus]|uniref:Lrp/AsnC family transcriptional regulator n=2 Tax=Paenibacillus TaxID=44249 RepID=A0ABU3R9Y3_9BACL|nr:MULTISPECIES: Lrp/AsnC family transcriptional regulator [Paenibacillus]MCY9659285.1 Lrp/AsnC family transcriptional regulator [Paenibacillus anseongense]MDU0201089.1 Lrp/AsnC family transcriptional regulator [Paenibacillus sp. PFR10]MEB4796379.1 Lrp/AsnC family transcriptional regulator [Paenibacillus chondroitinus]MEC0264947.1 Lrp/AsnC family transcriptional regulator [Paenibacillus anseongense]